MAQSNENSSRIPRIIVIDDQPDIHKDFSAILAPEQNVGHLENLERALFGDKKCTKSWSSPTFELEFAHQGQLGVEKITSAINQDNPFQLAFIDMRMPPGWDGLRTIQEIWRVDPEIQVVLCTAYSDYSWEEINSCLDRTDNLLILKKPFDSNEVSQLASTLTQKWFLARKADLKQQELEHLVEKRTEELKDKNRALEEEIAKREELEEQLIRSKKMEAIGTLAAGVAHDLNNILSGILTYPDLLLVNMAEDDPMYKPLSIIKRSGCKAAAIVNDMLTFARQNVAIKKPTDLAGIVRDFIDGPEFKVLQEHQKNTRVVLEVAPAVLPVSGSAVHLDKLVMNLITNGVESMEKGGLLKIEICMANLSLPLPGYGEVIPGEYIKMTVSDEGSGIAPGDLAHIFEPFFTKKKMGNSGTGLGMTVVWDTVKKHEGYIVVESELNRGTSISIYLAAAFERIPRTRRRKANQDLGGRGERILVVDDVEEQREIASAIFKELGYLVDTVSSGEIALEYLGKQPVDLLVLDMVMDPGIDGLETLIGALSLNPGQKAVIASGYSKNERVQVAIEMGASFLHKPYQMEEIAQTVKEVLDSDRVAFA